MVKNTYTQIKEIKEYAICNKIPIMQDAGIDFLTTFIIKHQIKNVLEVGTAIGYSAIMMSLCSPNLKVTTIERDEHRYMEALKNIKKMNLEDRITPIFNDALNVKLDDKYDLIFIDAAKAQNIKFFELFERNLNPEGYIITDNMYFHGLVKKNEKEIVSSQLKNQESVFNERLSKVTEIKDKYGMENENLINENQDLIDSNNKLKESNDSLKSDIEELKESYNILEEEKEKTSKEYLELKEEYNNLIDKYNDMVDELVKINSYKKRNNLINRKFKEYLLKSD